MLWKLLFASLTGLAERLNKLEQSSKDRDLPAETRAKIVQLLAPHRDTQVTLQVMAGDRESRQFLTLLRQCFVDAGWSVGGPVLVFDKVFPRGLHIVVSKDSGSPSQLALGAALTATGQAVEVALNTSVPPGTFRVVVGPK